MEGKHEQQKPAGRKAPVVLAAAAAVLAAAYIGLCAWVGGQDRAMPNVSVSGIDVSGLTAQEVNETVARARQELGGAASVRLNYQSWSGVLYGDQFQTADEDAGAAAVAVGREHFLTQGFQYLRHLAGGGDEAVTGSGDVPQEQPELDRVLADLGAQMGFSANQASYEVKSDRLEMTKGTTGRSVDRQQVLSSAASAMAEAYRQAVGSGGQAAETELNLSPMVKEMPPEAPDFGALYQQLHTEVVDAAMDPETYEITEGQDGVDLDLSALEREYDQAGEGETFSVPLTITKAKETKATLESKLFKDVLGQATSKVSGTANRKTNVKLAAAACNGKILLPGEVFSYNGTTGSRTADKGYLPAPIYVGGKSQDDVGGGICQPSSTIYYAVLHTTLEIVERHNHTFAVGYVPDGMDATVYYGSLDFQFKNSTDYPIKIVTESYDKDGSRYLTVKILGTNADGRYAKPERTQFDWEEPTTVYKPDSSVARGTLVLDKEQYAYKGRKAQTFRYIYEKDGTLVEKQDLGVSKYKMRPHTYYYNPEDGDPSTWTDGQPPKSTVDSGTTTDPGTTVDPGTTTDPGTTVDPGTATDPGATTDPGTATDPGAATDPGQTGGSGPAGEGGHLPGQSGSGEETPEQP